METSHNTPSQTNTNEMYESMLDHVQELQNAMNQALNPIIVITIARKSFNSSTDRVKVSLFNDIQSANKYIKDTQDLHGKYWRVCKIVHDNEYTEITSPY